MVFEPEHAICRPPNPLTVCGVCGVCDWVGSGLESPGGVGVQLLEVKFVAELGNAHRLQVLV